MSSEKYWLKSGFIAAAMATTAWVAIPALAQEENGEETTEATHPENTGGAVSEFAKTLKDLPPEERAEAAKMLRVIAQENLPEVALENRPEQAGQGPLNRPETTTQTETTPLRPTTAGRPAVRPSAANRPQRPQRPIRPQRPGRGRN